MSVTINIGFQQIWNADSALDSTVKIGQGSEIFVGDTIIDPSGRRYVITAFGAFDSINLIYNDCEFVELVDAANILPIIGGQGWAANTSRNYENAGIGFGTSRFPNSTNDTSVIASISLTSTLLTAAIVQVQVAGSVVSEVSLSGLAATSIQMATFIVPVGSSYELVNTSGAASLVYLKELAL